MKINSIIMMLALSLCFNVMAASPTASQPADDNKSQAPQKNKIKKTDTNPKKTTEEKEAAAKKFKEDAKKEIKEVAQACAEGFIWNFTIKSCVKNVILKEGKGIINVSKQGVEVAKDKFQDMKEKREENKKSK